MYTRMMSTIAGAYTTLIGTSHLLLYEFLKI